jgi:transcriptional regulator with XRE-family HTH domain
VLKLAKTDNIDYQGIGSRIKAARLSKGYTQPQLSELLGVSPEYISKLETARSHPGLPMLAEIAKHLNVSLSYLIDGSTKSAEEFKLFELEAILKDMSPNKRQALFEIAKVIIYLPPK